MARRPCTMSLLVYLLLDLLGTHTCLALVSQPFPRGLPLATTTRSRRPTSLLSVSPALMTPTLDIDLDALRLEAMGKYVRNTNGIAFAPTSGGVNNFMDYVTLPSGDKFVLRIYNNGLNTPRVEFEHRILEELQAADSYPFAIPTAVRSLTDNRTHVKLSTAAEATLFKFIPGSLPKKACVKEIGQAAGKLVTAMGKITKTIGDEFNYVSPNPPYYDLYRAHHALTRELFYEEISKVRSAADQSVVPYIDLLVEEIRMIEEFISRVQALDPPLQCQLIHADLHYDNILCQDGQVTGLLDFEFCAFDWRAMELAVCLSKYADKPDEALDIFRQFVSGFSELGRLSAREAVLIPDLIILRILSNVVYFIGRSLSGEDSSASLTTRAENYYKRIEWIHRNRQTIVDLVKDQMRDD